MYEDEVIQELEKIAKENYDQGFKDGSKINTDLLEACQEAKDILIALGIDSGNYNQMFKVREIGQEIAAKLEKAIAKAKQGE